MSNRQNALEKALFDRLSVEITGATVAQHVMENAPAPLVVIGAISSDDEGSKDIALDLFTVVIATEVKANGRKVLNSLQAQVRTALDRWQPQDTDAVTFGEMMPTGTDPTGLSDDGQTYFGAQNYRIFVQDN